MIQIKVASAKQLDNAEREWVNTIGRPGINHAVSVLRIGNAVYVETTEGESLRFVVKE